MSRLPRGLANQYASALADHLDRTGEEALHQAYELGRTALGEGLGVLDLVLLHHDAMARLMSVRAPSGDRTWLAAAAGFLAECLSPFEMTLRGYQETNVLLSEANADLTQSNAAVAVAQAALDAQTAERRRAETALLHAQRLQAVGLLAGGVAHHFNNLLTVVLGNLELARSGLKQNKDVDRFLLSARHGAQRGAGVVKQLLTFSRQQVLEAEVVDTAGWLAEVAKLLAASLRGDIMVETDVPAPVWPIRIDAVQLELALLNLGVNARDAMPGGGLLRISCANRRIDDGRLSLRGDFVVIEVTDTGEGVDPAILPRVFDPFFTTKALGPGAGLGLSHVHGFINQSGGAVEMVSVIGEGTTVRLYLPAAVGEVAALAGLSQVASVSDGHGRVLVVDDDVEVADMAGQLLEASGYSVKLAYRAGAALELLKDGEAVDLVFSDVIMPGGMSGVQLAEEVGRSFPKLPVLLATGYSDAIAEANLKGLNIIMKPYATGELRERIDALLNAGQAPTIA